ncbi:hypothetical protein Pint_23194 [Pistacia integerrima]|uniref:Uncharacterized protein n=1 Tax=Pistacia integerrima TaxID=434235 RepID=A0ACC0YGG1_9ROSI|nr:hypothetical protein Pint_23194 [Pistacia integerrima]
MENFIIKTVAGHSTSLVISHMGAMHSFGVKAVNFPLGYGCGIAITASEYSPPLLNPILTYYPIVSRSALEFLSAYVDGGNGKE